MRFLADEDFPKPLADKIKSLGFSVKTIQQKNLQGSSDETVADIAVTEKRILLTFDKDFAKGIFEHLHAIIFSFPKTPTSEIVPLMESFLKDLKQKPVKIKKLKFSIKGLKEI